MYKRRRWVHVVHIRKHLECCYDHNNTEKAVLVGNLLDKMQCLKIVDEQKKAANNQSFKLSHLRGI